VGAFKRRSSAVGTNSPNKLGTFVFARQSKSEAEQASIMAGIIFWLRGEKDRSGTRGNVCHRGRHPQRFT
jgi:hypothetical protein